MIKLNIFPSSGVPIYKQVYEQIERMIVNEHVNAGGYLPSVRQVAADLNVNPMTVSKAYGLLEERGYLRRQRGRGMLVIKREVQISQEEKIAMLDEKIITLVAEAEQMGISQQALLALFKKNLTKAVDTSS